MQRASGYFSGWTLEASVSEQGQSRPISDGTGEMSLAESLICYQNWANEWFIYNGPNAPYVRINYSFLKRSSVFDPISRMHRWVFRRAVPIQAHLSRFDAIKISASAYQEFSGCRWVPDQFPFNRWLRFHFISGATAFACADEDHNHYIVEYGALCFGSGVRLRGR